MAAQDSADKTPVDQDLSCLMDGELGHSEALFLLRRLSHDDQLKVRWQRWHDVRSALNGPGCRPTAGLQSRVAAAIADDPLPSVASDPGRWPRLLKPVAGLGVAAAVALVALNLLPGEPAATADGQPLALSSEITERPPAIDETPTRAVGLSARAASSGVTRAQDPLAQEYLLRHNQVSNTRRGQGLVPYIYLMPNAQQWQPTDSERAQARSGDDPAQP